MHILLISNTRSGMSGADRDCISLLNSFASDQIRVSWVGVSGCEKLRPYINDKVIGRLIDLNLPWFTYFIQQEAYKPRSIMLWGRILTDHAIRLWEPIQKIRSIVQDDPVDLIISNTAAITIGSILSRLWKLPHVWFIKECLDTSVRAVRNYTKVISRSGATVVAPSKAVAASFPGQVCVIPDGTDAQKVQARSSLRSRTDILKSFEWPIEQPVVAQVGALVYWKGQRITAEALLRMALMEPEPYFSLLFLGKGDENYRKEIEIDLSKLSPHWRRRVRFAEFDPDDYSLINAADIVVHPSILPDPFPNAVREAMILGKPVIGSNSGGIPEMIRDGETGILFEAGNADALARRLTLLLRWDDLRFKMGKAAQEFGLSSFDIANRRHDFLRLFYDLLTQNKRQTIS